VTGPPPIEGRAVRLRPPHSAELRRLHDWYNDPEVVAPFDRFSTETFDEFESELRSAPGDPRSTAPRYVVALRADDRAIGFVGHYLAHPVLELLDVWYVLGDVAERGKGYGREAVELLVAHLFEESARARVGATADVDNVASNRLLEGLGFRREGTLRSSLFHHNRWHDVTVYGVTRSEWEHRPGATGS
jgi:RimJ/RimL family protein N-acetyltransferase